LAATLISALGSSSSLLTPKKSDGRVQVAELRAFEQQHSKARQGVEAAEGRAERAAAGEAAAEQRAAAAEAAAREAEQRAESVAEGLGQELQAALEQAREASRHVARERHQRAAAELRVDTLTVGEGRVPLRKRRVPLHTEERLSQEGSGEKSGDPRGGRPGCARKEWGEAEREQDTRSSEGEKCLHPAHA